MSRCKRKKLLFMTFLFLLIFTMVSVKAVTWNTSIGPFYGNEGTYYSYNISNNTYDVNGTLSIVIDTTSNYITWDNGTGVLNNYSSLSSFPWMTFNTTDFFLNINSSRNNQSGKFQIPFSAKDDGTYGTLDYLTFIVNATNDAPLFTNLNSTYDFVESSSNSYTITASDEEKQYPLAFNLSFLNNCTHATWSSNTNCDIFNLTSPTNTSTLFNFTPTHDDVGTYWANLTVRDSGANYPCPTPYCDNTTYEQNQSSKTYLLKFNIFSVLSIDASTCNGATVEGQTFNCTINITTQGENDTLEISSYGLFQNSSYTPNNKTWFYPNSTNHSSGLLYTIPISITPTKTDVGNWTINLTVLDTNTSTQKTTSILLFVNYTESNVSLGYIPNINSYQNQNFTINATDDDFLIQDKSVKNESLIFASNTSWVKVGYASSPTGVLSSSVVEINHTYATDNNLTGNQSIKINVTDSARNTDSQIFTIDISIDNPPQWSSALPTPVSFNLSENQSFSYNFSANVSDADGDNITFYYENISNSFCSLKDFNLSGTINFIPIDCDVGFHNVSVIASDGKMNTSKTFLFNISNIDDPPTIFSFSNNKVATISEGANLSLLEGDTVNFNLVSNDDDFLISQKSYYNESLSVTTTFFKNLTEQPALFNFSFIEFKSPLPQSASYSAIFTPVISQVGNWTVVLNITDASGESINRTFFLDIEENVSAPVLSPIANQSLTIYDNLNLTINATDDKDDYYNLSLNYTISKLNSSAPNLTISNNTILGNMTQNDAGKWAYNLTVKDSRNLTDSQVFYLSVYGNALLITPSEFTVFSLKENKSSSLNFTITHAVKDNLTYEFWINNISCSFQNNSNCVYGNSTLRESIITFGNGSNITWDFTPNFQDETYGNLKNLTVSVYPANSSNLTLQQRESVATNFTFNLNITHTNAPIRIISNISLLQSDYNSNIKLNLNNYFTDEDVNDPYYLQNVTFVKLPSSGDIFITHTGGWNVQIGTTLKTVHTENISINGSDGATTAQIDNIPIEFTAPPTTPTPTSTPTSSKTSTTRLKFYSLRIITPGQVTISNKNYIEVPFTLENSGGVDLRGINLSTSVFYNNEFAKGVKVDLGIGYLDFLKAGEKKNYTMKIFADTNKAGQYRATLFANITSPKFTDWADFFINLRKTNDTQAEKLLIFTDKIIADNPECLELTEDFRRAKAAFAAGNVNESMKMAQKVSVACENAIKANEQIRYDMKGIVEKNFSYIAVLSLIIFLGGFIFYAYKRARFNKSSEDEYLR